MKIHLVLICLLYSSICSGQKDMSIDFVGSFDYANISNGSFTTYYNSFSEFAGSSGVTGIYTKRYGVNFNFRIYENIMFKTGLRFASLGDKFYAKDIKWPFEYEMDVWAPSDLEMRYVKESNTHRYIEIPLIVRYEINRKKIQPYFELGLSPHIYWNSKFSSDSNKYEDEYTYEKDSSLGFNKLQYALVFGVGINFQVNKKLKAFLQPTFRHNLTIMQINADGSNANFYSLGLEFGIRYFFSSYYNSLKS